MSRVLLTRESGRQCRQGDRQGITKPPTWQAAAWLLERKFPGEFGRRVVEPEGKVKGSAATRTIQIVFGDEDEEGEIRQS